MQTFQAHARSCHSTCRNRDILRRDSKFPAIERLRTFGGDPQSTSRSPASSPLKGLLKGIRIEKGACLTEPAQQQIIRTGGSIFPAFAWTTDSGGDLNIALRA